MGAEHDDSWERDITYQPARKRLSCPSPALGSPPLARRRLCSVAANVRVKDRILGCRGGRATMKVLGIVAALVGIAVGSTVVAAGPLGVQTASAAPVHPVVRCRRCDPSRIASVRQRNWVAAIARTFRRSRNDVSCWPRPYPILWSTGRELALRSAVACGLPPSGFRTPSRCTIPQTREYDWVGSVATSVGPWTKRFVGDTVTFDVCLTSSFGIDGLVPGTAFRIFKP